MTSTGFAFIGVVHGLLESSRSSEKADLMLAAVLQALYEADRSGDEVLLRVQEIWPGAVKSVEEIDAALALGAELGLVAQTAVLGGSQVWTLTKSGAQDVAQHVTWVTTIRERAAGEIAERARTGLQIELAKDQADLWLDRLVRSLASVIRSSQRAYEGDVEALLGGASRLLAPRNLDRDAVLAAFGDDDGAITQFLRALAFAALDPLDPFGNELVSHITTGCILHAFVAGMDRNRLLKRIGAPVDQRVVLDTPVLIDLLGPPRLACSLEQTVRTAIKAGWEVVALEHSIEEARQVLHRDVPRIQEEFQLAHAQGTREAWYATLTVDQLPSLCIEVLREGTYRNLEQLLVAADGLADRLTELGVVVRPHGNGEDPRVARLAAALVEQLQGAKQRSTVVIERDAHTMAMAWRARRRAVGHWPGAWIITKDRAMSPAFAAVSANDNVALTLTPAQWATLLSVSAEPMDVEQLARAAADQFVDEAMWTLPVRYPPEVALELARQLSPEEGGSGTDLRVAQMTLDEALDETAGSTAVASRVLSGRAQRINSISRAEAQRLSEGLSEQKGLAQEAAQRAMEADLTRMKTEQNVESLRSENAAILKNLAWQKEHNRRWRVSAGLCSAAAIGLTASLFLASPLTWALLGSGLVVLAVACWRWTSGPDSSLKFLFAGGVLDLVGVISGVLEISGAL